LESKIEKKFSGPQTKRGLTKGADRNQATLSGICNSGHAITGFLIRNTPIRISNPAIGIVPDCKSRPEQQLIGLWVCLLRQKFFCL
jgi:hypothetical protein